MNPLVLYKGGLSLQPFRQTNSKSLWSALIYTWQSRTSGSRRAQRRGHWSRVLDRCGFRRHFGRVNQRGARNRLIVHSRAGPEEEDDLRRRRRRNHRRLSVWTGCRNRTVRNHHRRSSQSHQCFNCGLKRVGEFRGNRIWNDPQHAHIKRARVSGHKFLDPPPTHSCWDLFMKMEARNSSF